MSNRLLYTSLGSIFVIMLGLYFIKFGFYPLSESPQNWGAFGDFLGGILNPILSFAALIVLIKTIKQNEKALKQNEEALSQNAKEMKYSRAELEKSAKAHKQIVDLELQKIKSSDYRFHQDLYEKRVDRHFYALERSAKNITLLSSGSEPICLSDINIDVICTNQTVFQNEIDKRLIASTKLHLSNIYILCQSLLSNKNEKFYDELNDERISKINLYIRDLLESYYKLKVVKVGKLSSPLSQLDNEIIKIYEQIEGLVKNLESILQENIYKKTLGE